MPLITPFDPWENKICSCPKKYSLSPYTGCSHNCLYCYASSYIRDFSKPREKKDFLNKLQREIKKIPENSIIAISNSSDPYIPLEKKLKITRQLLEILTSYKLKINLITKSSLILSDLDLLKTFKSLVVSISLTTLNEQLSKKLEPNVSSPHERLLAIKKISYYLPVVCRFDPIIYNINDTEIPYMIKKLKQCGVKQIITSTYKIKPDNFKRMINVFPNHQKIWHKLYYKEGQRINNSIYLSEILRKKIIDQIRDISSKENILFSSCREGFNDLNTAKCDGSSLFKEQT
ncbi:MAG: radical SAM protein [Candidatus Omnitrophica bacterium]|nr:radical SAM protein [Candidatus Omnitrophota bacterium]